MSDLRERAAIAAMQGILAHPGNLFLPMPLGCAKDAVEHADALLAELARTTSPTASPHGSYVPVEVLKEWRAIAINGWLQVRLDEIIANAVTLPQPTAGACTAAERELIEASISSQITNNFQPWYAAIEAVRAERRAASVAKGGA